MSVGGTASGTVHRGWRHLKGKLDSSDHALLETVEAEENAAEDAYADALSGESLSERIRAILITQQTQIQESHNQIQAFLSRKAP